MKFRIDEMILKCLESEKAEDVLEEEGEMAAPATDSSATNGSLPVPMFSKIAKRKSLEDKELKI